MKISITESMKLTSFLMEQKIVFHPTISPRGRFDFTNRYDRENIIILDRNIVSQIVELCKKGILQNSHNRKVISSLLFWTITNNIKMTGGFAFCNAPH